MKQRRFEQARIVYIEAAVRAQKPYIKICNIKEAIRNNNKSKKFKSRESKYIHLFVYIALTQLH
jgi:hypothetical protein